MHHAVAAQESGQGAAARRLVGPIAVAAVAVAGVMAAIGTYVEGNGNGNHSTGDFLAVCAIIAVGAAVVFGWVVPKMLDRASQGIPALVLAVLGLLTVAVFWSGLPPILAAGGGLLAWAGRDAAHGRGLCRAALVIAVLAVVADVAVLIGDTTNSI